MPLCQMDSDSLEAPGKAFARRPCAVCASGSGRHLGGTLDRCAVAVHTLRALHMVAYAKQVETRKSSVCHL